MSKPRRLSLLRTTSKNWLLNSTTLWNPCLLYKEETYLLTHSPLSSLRSSIRQKYPSVLCLSSKLQLMHTTKVATLSHFKTTTKPITHGKMRVSLALIFNFSSSFQKEESISQLAKMIMHSTLSTTVDLSCRKWLISIPIELYLTVALAKLYITLNSTS